MVKTAAATEFDADYEALVIYMAGIFSRLGRYNDWRIENGKVCVEVSVAPDNNSRLKSFKVDIPMDVLLSEEETATGFASFKALMAYDK